MLPKIRLEQDELLGVLEIEGPKIIHGVRNPAHERREQYHAHDDRNDVEDSLRHVLRRDLHGSRRELRQRPMQASCIQVPSGRIRWHVYGDPPVRGVYVKCGQAIPRARNHMICHDDENQHLPYASERVHMLRPNVILQSVQKWWQSDHPSHAQALEHPEGAQGPKHASGRLPIFHKKQYYIERYESHVKEEPTRYVTSGDLF
mmetsp:Transcript_101087/g.282099  ORF Transcript_101087/g.282099 Transcript_101087/m.282099 type:complete len:203 (-) Transcript_101087:394-1002(-)